MIENNRQLGITFKAMEAFMDNLMKRTREGRPDDVAPEIWQAEHDAIWSVVRELRGEIADYLEKLGALPK